MSNQHKALAPIPPPNPYTVEDIRKGNLPAEQAELVEKLKRTSKELK